MWNYWDIDFKFKYKHEEVLRIRNLRKGDLPLLLNFGERLGTESKRLFYPYPWDDESLLPNSFTRAIKNSVTRIDTSYLIINQEGKPIGHFFLWKAGGNELSQRFGVEVPELGVAIADSYHGKGLGHFSVRFLQKMAREMGGDAIELTTAFDNDAGWNIYLKTGFEYVGNIQNPLEVDATEVAEGKATAQKFREERQMVYVVNELRREEVLKYLAFKRETAERLK
jgi:GNAT superfamily N-acetyltransferase